MCDCIEKIHQMEKSKRDLKIVSAEFINTTSVITESGEITSCFLLTVHLIDKDKSERKLSIIAKYCPMCGKKYEEV